ncbi:MAG: glycosyltransferase family 1 protein [bacterium]
MLIGIDASRANRKFKSGTEWYSYHLIRELAKIDSKNQYILYSDKPLKRGLIDLTDENDSDNPIKINSCGWQEIKSQHGNFRAKILKWPFQFLWTQARLSYEILAHPVDILFIPAHALPIIHPKKSIVTIHDIGFERYCNLYNADKIGPENGLISKIFDFLAQMFTFGKFRSNILDYHSWSAKFSLSRAAAIIAVSEFTKKEIMELYKTDEKKIKVVRHGLDGKLYRRISDNEKIEQVLNKYDIKKPYIFYVGRLEKKKNTAKLVEAYAVMRKKFKHIKHKMVLVGSAGFGFDEVKYVINEFDIEEDVIITGWIPESDMPYIYNGADMFVFPSIYEGFGIPLLEAMSCGTPIAASNTASIPEVAQDAALLFNPENKDDMAEKMAKILSDKQFAEKLAEKGFARIKDFSLEKCAKQTLELIENI